MKHRRKLALLMAVCLLLSGCGLRVRVLPGEHGILDDDMQTAHTSAGNGSGEIMSDALLDDARMPDDQPGEVSDEADGQASVAHSDQATRREYAEHVSAEKTAGASQAAYAQADGELPPLYQPGGTSKVDQVQDTAGLTLTERVSREEAKELAAAENAKAAESLLQYYQALLHTKTDSMFECQRLYVYWENVQPHETVHKSSTAHAIISLAGGYDVAVKRPEDALVVDDGWVSRKDPGCIVKLMPAETTAAEAQSLRSELAARPDWRSVNAVRSGKLLVLNEVLLESAAGQTAAALLLASAMYPDVFSELDMSEALQQLLGSAGFCLYAD